ncbi:unnamed protein product [Adineta steineri]|uniref:MD-2-related lipid-recognition domain-containing protein n=1 Tax=Adineta steineri TaxID=433720 RepID=A0A814EKQ2_9BILA|nr:unnamed protein product [Adineta steineri]
MLSIQSIVLVAVQGQFTFKNCGTANHHIQLKGLKITPHPVILPGLCTFELLVNVTHDIIHPLQTKFDIKAKVLGFEVPIQCEGTSGSCTHADWCGTACTTCECPVKAGGQTLTIPLEFKQTLPLVSSGTVNSKIEYLSATGQTGCIEVSNVQVRNK